MAKRKRRATVAPSTARIADVEKQVRDVHAELQALAGIGWDGDRAEMRGSRVARAPHGVIPDRWPVFNKPAPRARSPKK